MAYSLRTVDRTKLYTSIVDQIVEGIRSGGFTPGTALPPERTLADQLGVSRTSVREAIRVLEHAGVLDVRIGSGTYVTDAGLTRAATMRAQTALRGETSPLDVMIARRAIEPVCAEQAATNRLQRDLDHLRATLDEHARLVEEADEDGARHNHPLQADFAFHVGVAAASHSDVFVMVVESLVGPLLSGLSNELFRKRERGYDRDAEEHREVYRAIELRDPSAAARAMSQHLAAVEYVLAQEDD